jgi:hypothetical protein
MAKNSVVDGFIPELWDASIMRTLEDNLVAKKICRNYSNIENGRKGQKIHFNGLADPTITAYSGSVSYEALVDASMDLILDTDVYYAFDIDDVDAAMSVVDLKGSQTQRAAYKLKQNADTAIMSLYAQAAAGTVTDATCDTATILSDLGLMGQYLAENGVPEGDMWVVIPPWVKLKLQLAGIKFSTNEGLNGKGGMAWASELGFDIFVTNQVVETAGTPVSQVLAGSYNAIGYAQALEKSEAFRAEASFATHVRGRLLYGTKVLKPKELALGVLTYAAETAI